MKRFAFAVFSLLIAAPAWGATIYTPMVVATNIPGQSIDCRVINVSKKTVPITVEAIDAFTGETIGSQTCDTPPRTQACSPDVACTSGGGESHCQVYCRFSSPLRAGQMRGSVQIIEGPDGTPILIAPAH